MLLPTSDNQGKPYPNDYWETLKTTLSDKFGGVTAYSRAPAEGIWAPEGRTASKENVFVVEVMTDDLDEDWWSRQRRTLERELDQEEIVIRALPYTKL
jgi:hypothetical protein